MAKKIDPLNKKQYGAVSAMLTVSDMKAAVNFYQKAFGFTKRGMMTGPDARIVGNSSMTGLGKSCPSSNQNESDCPSNQEF